MKDWFSAAELAELRLPELPGTERAVQLRASRESWPYRARAGQGGGREYHISVLPKDARDALLAHHRGPMVRASEAYAGSTSDAAGRDLAEMTDRERCRADAMLEILKALGDWRTANPKAPKFGGYEAFATLYNLGHVDIPDWVREARPTVSKNTLHKAMELRGQGRLKALAGRYGNRRETGAFDRFPQLESVVVGVMNKAPRTGPRKAREVALTELGERIEAVDPKTGEIREIPMPGEKTFERFINKWKKENAALHAAVTDPDGYRNKYQFAVGRMYEQITQFNQLWEIDASPSDVLCTDGRYSIYVLVDIYSRWPKIRVTKTPRMAAALLLVRDCILDFGMPRELSTDNGSDFIGDQFRTTIRHLGIHQHVCDPFSPEQKACVERTIGTIQHSFMELQPGYIGHSVAERKRIEERKAFANRLGAEDDKVFQVELTGEDLQQRLNNWVDNVYVHRPHDGLDGRTPFEMRSGYRGTISRLPEDAEGLLEHMLMAPADGKTRIVSKKGVRVDTIEYLFTDAVLMPGEEVHVRLDPDDLGRVYLYQDDPWRFVSVAINPERTGVSRAEAAVKLKRSQAEVIAEGKKKIRADMRGINLATVTERMAQRGQEETASLLAFPTKSETHVTPEIEAAAKAKRAGKAPVTPIRTEADKKAAEALVAELKAKPVDERAVKRARVERALAIEATLAAGEPAHEEDIRWFETYRTLPEFKTAKVMLEDFGRLVV